MAKKDKSGKKADNEDAKQKRQIEKAEIAAPKRKDSIYLVCGLLSFVIAAVTTISLISYLHSWISDQSVISSNDYLTTDVEVANKGGKLGLALAHLLVDKIFGLGALIIPFFFLGLSAFCLKIKKIKLLRFTFLSLFGCIILSLTFSYIFSLIPLTLFYGGAGGSYGYYVIKWANSMFGAFGTGGLLLLLIVIWLIFVDNRIVARFNNWMERVTAPRPKKEKRKKEMQQESAEPAFNESALSESAQTESAEHDACEPVMDVVTGTESATLYNSEENIFAGQEGHDFEQSEALGFEQYREPVGEGEVDNDNIPKLEVLSAPEPIPAENTTAEDITDEELLDSQLKEEEDVGLSTNGDEENFEDAYTHEQLRTLFDPRLELPNYQAPSLSLLESYRDKWYEVSPEELEKNNRQIVKTLSNYKIGVSKISARIGPTVTLYEIVPAPGVRVAQIKRLEEDIQLSLAAKGVRVVTLKGTNAIGIEVANERPSTVSMLSVLDDAKFKAAEYDLPVALGKTITNEVMHFDLAKMPHLLVAGATGQGKSVGLNAILASLLYRKHPSELKLVLVDPKKVELSLYSKLEKHFLAQLPDADEPVITDTQKVIYTLKSLCIEMDSRYDLLKMAHVRNVKEYNEKFLQRRLNPLKGHKFMPYIVVVIDEFADLLMTAGKEIEEPIARLAQLARAIGIHLVIATQRPTTSVITGNIKANFPARIAFMVRSSIDSRTILDETGANQLIGRGDMLISTGGDLTRVQCAFIDTKEVERIVDSIASQPGYSSPFYLPEYTGEEKEDGGGVGEVDLNRRDPLFEDAAKLVVMHQQGSTSLIQRKMNLGYNRSGRIMDQLEVAGIVGPFEGSKARQVLVADLSELDLRLSSIRDIYGG